MTEQPVRFIGKLSREILLDDLGAAMDVFLKNGVNLNDLQLTMTSSLARTISKLESPLGLRAFPLMSGRGGTLLGWPVVISDHLDTKSILIGMPCG